MQNFYLLFTYGKTKQIVNLILFLITDIQAHKKTKIFLEITFLFCKGKLT